MYYRQRCMPESAAAGEGVSDDIFSQTVGMRESRGNHEQGTAIQAGFILRKKERDSIEKGQRCVLNTMAHSRENVRENVFRDIEYAGTHPICRTWSNTPKGERTGTTEI